MKTNFVVMFVALLLLCCCHSGNHETIGKVTFGIHEMVNAQDIPPVIMDTLISLGAVIDSNHREPAICYIPEADSGLVLSDLSQQNIKLVRSHNTVGSVNRYYEVIAVRPVPVIDNSHILNSRVKGDRVVIDLNLEGARKLADLTKNNIGNHIAFVIDNQVYSLPMIINEIKEGSAVISGLNDESDARRIAAALNASRPK